MIYHLKIKKPQALFKLGTYEAKPHLLLETQSNSVPEMSLIMGDGLRIILNNSNIKRFSSSHSADPRRVPASLCV